MNQLETLLNSLIKMGWKPWGKLEANECTVEYQKQVCIWNKHYRMLRKGSLRELVSLESGLWQICTERELTKSKTSEHMINRYIKELITREEGDFVEADVLCTDLDPEWRLMESALIPEDKLGQFLLDNIKIEGMMN